MDPSEELVGYLVQENKWSKDKSEALVFEIPPIGFSSEQTPVSIQVIVRPTLFYDGGFFGIDQILDAKGGKQDGAWTLGVIGPRNRRHSRFRPAREAKESWSFNTHAMSTTMLDTQVFACLTNCWVMFGDELRLVWPYEDGSKSLYSFLSAT